MYFDGLYKAFTSNVRTTRRYISTASGLRVDVLYTITQAANTSSSFLLMKVVNLLAIRLIREGFVL